MSRIDLTPADTTAMGVLPSSVRSALMSRPGQTSYRVMCKHEGSNSIGDENTIIMQSGANETKDGTVMKNKNILIVMEYKHHMQAE